MIDIVVVGNQLLFTPRHYVLKTSTVQPKQAFATVSIVCDSENHTFFGHPPVFSLPSTDDYLPLNILQVLEIKPEIKSQTVELFHDGICNFEGRSFQALYGVFDVR